MYIPRWNKLKQGAILMMKKISIFTTAVALTASLLNPGFVSAKDSDLSYDQVMKQLEMIKENIQEESTLTLSEKEDISKNSHELVNDFLKANHDLDNESQHDLLNSLKAIDGLMYNVTIEKGNINFGSKSSNFTQSNEEHNSSDNVRKKRANHWSGTGDILISLEAKTYGFPHGHAAILSTTEDFVIEALPRPGVVHQSATKYWSTVDDEAQYYVKGASKSDYRKAVSYARDQIGKPYKLKTSLNNESKWYCSKLVFKAWEYAGFRIGSVDEYLGIVLPASIISDWDVVEYISDPY